MLKFLFSLIQHAIANEEVVDLSALGMSDFAPYIYERDPKWIILPLLALMIVFVHLKKNKIKR